MIRTILEPLSSLRLTVGLLAISVFVVWVITLDQVRLDIWDVKQKHFSSAIVYVPFQTLLPPGWFPSLQNIPGGFYVPSGFTLIILLLANLTAAHVLRFRLQAKGARLAIGLLATVVAVALTWAIIFAGRGVGGIQNEPPISYRQMWTLLQVVALGLTIAAAVGVYMLDAARFMERILLGIFALTLGSILAYNFWVGQDSFIGDAGMRILWQLVQSSLAALSAMAACMLLFRRKAGIVLLHLGIAGLMVNEIYVTFTNVEQRMLIFEGQTTSHAIDVRSTELAVINRNDSEFDDIVVVPGDLLVPGRVIDDEQLPFRVETLDYYPNSQIVNASDPMAQSQENPADTGFGQQWVARNIRGTTGTDTEQSIDEAAAYVRLLDKESGQPMGTYLVSQRAYDNGIADDVKVGETDYIIGLRLKHVYKPYSVTLTDVQKKDYIGTEIPQWYSSDIVIDDTRQNQLSSTQKVWMNNPLRYGDETFYQSGYDRLPDGREYTVLQVVKNRGWMIPYVCCMFVVVGLFGQFGLTLVSYLKRNNKQARTQILSAVGVMSGVPGVGEVSESLQHARETDQKRRDELKEFSPQPSNLDRRRSWLTWAPMLVLVGIMVMYAGSKFARSLRPTVEHNGYRLELLGQLPITYGGRVQPLDSLARNTARQLSNRESVQIGVGEGLEMEIEKRPAIQWFADLIFEAPGYEDYQIIRIEDLNVQNALGLPRRKGLKYTLGEIQQASDKFRDLLPGTEVPQDEWTDLQKRLLEVSNKFSTLRRIQMAISDPLNRPGANDPLTRLEMADMLARADGLPYLLPVDSEEQPWLALSAARNRNWLDQLAEQYAERDPQSLGQKLFRQEMIKDQIIRTILSDEELQKLFQQMTGQKDMLAIRNRMMETWDQFPKELYQELYPAAEQVVDAGLARRPDLVNRYIQMIRNVNGPQPTIAPISGPRFDALSQLQDLYSSEQPDEFNQTLETYLSHLRQDEQSGTGPVGWQSGRESVELIYNAFDPFYMAMVVYLAAFFVSALAWLGWNREFNRAAFWMLVLGLTIHIGGLIARTWISGRPPVTNLYSSFVFVSAGAVAMMLIVELMSRAGIGNVIGSLAGAGQLMWAWTLSIDSGDTFTVLRAVLDTQFWLSTHVICVSMGYVATIAAGLLGCSFIIGGLLTPAMNERRRKSVTSMIYGITCFAIFFSFLGTVLGGLWADDSWGRFWGWDPKENGALMIVLWNAVVLHARWAGIVRQRGLAGLAAFGNIVTLWSWEGVNRLGVGLHAYGGVDAGQSATSILQDPMFWMQLFIVVNLLVCTMAAIPAKFWNFTENKASRLQNA